MNDFTKDELRHIGDALLYGITTLPERKDSLIAIRGKVLNMIDDYCDHESSEPLMALIKQCINCKCSLQYKLWGLIDENQ